MQSWQIVVVCVAVTLVSKETFGQPRALEEEPGTALLKFNEDIDQRQRQDSFPVVNIGNSGRRNEGILDEERKKIPRSPAQEGEGVMKSMKAPEKIQRILLDSVGEEKKDVTLGSTRVDLEGKGERKPDEDIARSKKSTDMRDISFHTSPTTTVCIQVRSNNLPPGVVCGPQVGEEKKTEVTAPSARFAFSPTSAQGWNPMYAQREQVPLQYPSTQKQNLYMRVSPQDIESSRPSAASAQHPQQIIIPQRIPSQGPSVSPKAARGPYALRRTQPEEDNTENPQPAASPVQPFRIIPQTPPQSVVVHKQYYQAAPLPPYATNLITPAQNLLRFNCALQPEGAQFLQTYGAPMIRSVPGGVLPGFIPVGGEVVIPETPSSRMAQDSQGFYYDRQGRSAQPDELLGSPYAYGVDPWVKTFVGEDGQLYIDETQGRSADGQLGREYLRASNPMTDIHSRMYQQEEQLRQSSEKLQLLQKQLKDIEQRSIVEEEEKKESKKTIPSTDRPNSHDNSDDSKKQEEKNMKRNSRHHINRR